MTGFICLAGILVVAAIAVAIMANSKKLYHLNLEASMVAQGLMYECVRNLDTFKSYTLNDKRVVLDFGTEPLKKGSWFWERDFRPVVLVAFSDEEDVRPVYESFTHALEKYQEKKDGRPAVRYAPIIRFKRKE